MSRAKKAQKVYPAGTKFRSWSLLTSFMLFYVLILGKLRHFLTKTSQFIRNNDIDFI
ncbi:MAG: hypothetical protein KBD76_07205 [Bacteriovorax sp.]|nr:hypothetical protein [Bacteriovorax sp.]